MNFNDNTPTFAYVNGIDGARQFPLQFGRPAVLMDTNDQVFYFKGGTPTGQYTITTYRFERVEDPKPVEYATKDDLDKILKKLEELKQ